MTQSAPADLVAYQRAERRLHRAYARFEALDRQARAEGVDVDVDFERDIRIINVGPLPGLTIEPDVRATWEARFIGAVRQVRIALGLLDLIARRHYHAPADMPLGHRVTCMDMDFLSDAAGPVAARSRTAARPRGAGRPGHRVVRSCAASGSSGDDPDPASSPPAQAGADALTRALPIGGPR